MVTAEDIYVDPSALCRLYLHQSLSREFSQWRRKTKGAPPITLHGRAELCTAICLAGFRGELSVRGVAEALHDLAADIEMGRMHQVDLLWRAALSRAAELSRVHTPALGTRAADVLHVASALELKLKRFVTFDSRQHKLAEATGLRVIQI